MISQRKCGQVIRLPPIVRKINRKITLVFHYFARIEKNASHLLCTGEIANIYQAIDIYEKYDKNIPLEWPISTSTDILRTSPKLKANLEKFEKYLLSTFHSLIKFFREKNIPEEENKTFDRKYKNKKLKFLLGLKKLVQIFFFDVKFF